MQNEELLRAQADLFAERERYFDLYDLAPVGYCVLSAEGLILEANFTASTLLGTVRSAFVQQPFSRFILTEDQDFDYLNRRQLIETGEPHAWELRMVRNDGTVFWAHLGATTARDESGAPVCRLVLSDIPERKRVEDALKESETRLREVLENSLDASYKRNLETDSYDYMSPVFARISGYTRDELESMPLETIMDLTLPDDTAEIKRVIAESMCGATGTAYQVDYRFKHKDGQYRWLHDQFTVMRDAGGQNLALIGSVSDITERKQAEDKLRAMAAELERSNKDLEQFAAIVSHDLQEPLRMVASYTQLLAERYEGRLDEKTKKYVAYVVDGAIRMQQLINDLMIYSRIGTHGTTMETKDSHSILGDAIRNLDSAIVESNAIITYDELPTVRFDTAQLVQVFQNLLANAIKFRGEGLPHVHVSARDDSAEWVFSIRDNGIGIDRMYGDRVFVIFQRLHTPQIFPGTGIGLAVCKRIVERHGGRIWFESEPGKGSTFFFTVPK